MTGYRDEYKQQPQAEMRKEGKKHRLMKQPQNRESSHKADGKRKPQDQEEFEKKRNTKITRIIGTYIYSVLTVKKYQTSGNQRILFQDTKREINM